MPSDLDTVYKALKRVEDGSGLTTADTEASRDAAATFLAQHFAANLWHRAGGDDEEYAKLYEQLATKAMVLITAMIGVVRDIARGNSNPQLDAFLKGMDDGQT